MYYSTLLAIESAHKYIQNHNPKYYKLQLSTADIGNMQYETESIYVDSGWYWDARAKCRKNKEVGRKYTFFCFSRASIKDIVRFFNSSAILDIQFGTHEYDWNYVEKRITLIIDTRYPLKFKIEIFARGIGDSEPHIITYHGRAKNLNRRTPITLSTGTNIFFVFR